jgi:hypothetical protein
MSRIQSGCNAYYLDFRAYPGPFSENQVYPQQAGNPVTPAANGTSLSLNPSAGMQQWNMANGVTSSENLWLGLEGNLMYPGPTPGSPVFYYTPPSSAPTGPQSLNSNNPGTHAAYMPYTPNETTYDGSSDANAGLASNSNNSNILAISDMNAATDSSIPEFVDHFNPARPILYMRARVGTTGMLLNISGATYPTSGTPPYTALTCQYNEQQLVPYGWVATPPAATSANYHSQMGPGVRTDNTTDFPVTSPYTTGDDVYFANPSLSGVPIGKDGYILISAGADGVYGTKDDIILAD